jgi:hypothetical protein
LMTHTSLPDTAGVPLRHFSVRAGSLVEDRGVRA